MWGLNSDRLVSSLVPYYDDSMNKEATIAELLRRDGC